MTQNVHPLAAALIASVRKALHEYETQDIHAVGSSVPGMLLISYVRKGYLIAENASPRHLPDLLSLLASGGDHLLLYPFLRYAREGCFAVNEAAIILKFEGKR
ncbi:hypothetical protein [Salipiger sp. PrR003]|uniref:hypothetical protein n=1 Tax=Salipiger sp. PrR003 TaxID=2706776 RepID=UPI0013D9F767|nr:hypothetical protein [Salipiger sp. PrR003]NDV50148.1 hypothetical protein [Salipiger sp. PrR003]